MPRPRLASLSTRPRLGALLLVAGIALLVASLLVAGTPGGQSRLIGRDRPVNAGAGNLGDISAHNSPSVARNPRDRDNIVVTSRIDSPDFSCAVHVSRDGGRRWSPTPVPIPRGPARKCYAPDAVFAADGTLYVSYVTLQGRGNTPSAAWVASSRDGGRTLSPPRRVAGRLAFQLRVAADPARPRRVYVSWVQAREVGALRFAGPGNPILLSRSDDGGRRWRRPVQVNAPSRGRVLAPSAAVGREGAVYVLYLDVGEDRLDYEGGHGGSGGPPYTGRFALVLGRSADGGSRWEESVVDDGIVPTERFVAFLPAFPALAVDRQRDRVYVAYHDRRLGSPDVWLWTLAPGETAWGKPVRVNDTPRRERTAQYLPRIDVAPDGRLDVVYYDRREDARRDVLNEVSLQSSDDGGRTFGARTTLSSARSDARVGLGTERGLPDLGSRLGLASDDRDAFAVWSDTRSGTVASLKQDLYSAAVDGGRTPGVVWALRVGGVALALLGALALVAGARRGRTT